jgi:hypothetical protein
MAFHALEEYPSAICLDTSTVNCLALFHMHEAVTPFEVMFHETLFPI